MNKQEAYEYMLKVLDGGNGVLTAGEIHPDIPLIHDVGQREGQRLQSATPVKHCGWGLFTATTTSGGLSFDGGGAMYRATDEDGKHAFSWTVLRAYAQVQQELGYDAAAVRAAIEELKESDGQ